MRTAAKSIAQDVLHSMGVGHQVAQASLALASKRTKFNTHDACFGAAILVSSAAEALEVLQNSLYANFVLSDASHLTCERLLYSTFNVRIEYNLFAPRRAIYIGRTVPR